MSEQDYIQLTLFPADSHASPFLSPGSAEARRMTVTSGRKCCALSRSSGPLGSLVRTLLVSSAWRSTRCLLTWKVSATPARRLLYRLAPLTPRTGDTVIVRRTTTVVPGVPVSMTTNGIGLDRKAPQLVEAGLTRINVSLDTIDREHFAAVTRRDRLPAVLKGIEAAQYAGLSPIKINAVAVKSRVVVPSARTTAV